MNYCVLDLGGTFIKAAIMNEKAEILEQWKVKSPTASWEECLEALDECILPHKDKVAGIAISMPGKIDSKKGIAFTGGAFTFIDHIPVGPILEERYGLPVAVDNDGKCAANAEVWVGALQDVDNGLVYVIGTAIGGGIVIDHKVVRGSHFAAGELSNCIVDMNQSGFSMRNVSAMKGGTFGMLHAYKHLSGEEQTIDGVEFFNRVHSGEELANRVFSDFCKFTASFFMTLQVVLDVDRICIGGGISAQPILIDTIRAELHELFVQAGPLAPMVEPEIVGCRYGNDANLIGALKNFMDLKKGQ